MGDANTTDTVLTEEVVHKGVVEHRRAAFGRLVANEHMTATCNGAANVRIATTRGAVTCVACLAEK